MPTSYNGNPVLEPGDPRIHNWVIRDEDQKNVVLTMPLVQGSRGFLLAHLAMWFDDRLEDLNFNYRNGERDDWGYAYRFTRGYSTWSNHASATAMDLNATEHPLAKRGTFGDEEESLIQKRLDFYHNCIRWGGDYVSRADEMHFEIDRTLAACERMAKRLLDSPRGERILRDNPGQRKVILS